MGNCLRTNKISAQDHYENYEAPVDPGEAKVEHIKKTSSSSSSSKLEAPLQEQSMKKKVRFKTHNGIGEGDRGSHGNSGNGAVRIRVVMTREELKRMLSFNNDAQHTTLEQLLSAVKLRRGRIYEVGEYDGTINSWRPALESIPEDRLIK